MSRVKPKFSFDFFICYRDKIIQYVKQILEGGNYEYWHSKTIKKNLTFLFQSHIALKPDIVSEQHLIRKDNFVHHFSIGSLGTNVALMEA